MTRPLPVLLTAAAMFLAVGGTCETNSPPDTPSTPIGPPSTIVGASQDYSTSTDDRDDDLVSLRIDWGDGGVSNWSVPVESRQSVTMSHTWHEIGDHAVRAQARDAKGDTSDWSEPLTVTCRDSANDPPDTPTVPDGPDSILTGVQHQYRSSATDPDNDIVSLRVSWGNDDTSNWSLPVPSGQVVAFDHAWPVAGTFDVRAQAQDPRGEQSGWSSPLVVVVSDSAGSRP